LGAVAAVRSRTLAPVPVRNSIDSSSVRNNTGVLDAILHFLHSLYNPDGLKELIRSGGAPLICAIVFVETGFFVGFFLPVIPCLSRLEFFRCRRDSPEVASHAGYVCAIVGDQIGYWIGRWQVRLYIAAKTLSSSAAATFNAPVTSIKNMAAGPLFSRALFPSFERSVRRSLVPRKCLYGRYLAFDICGGTFWVGAMILAAIL